MQPIASIFRSRAHLWVSVPVFLAHREEQQTMLQLAPRDDSPPSWHTWGRLALGSLWPHNTGSLHGQVHTTQLHDALHAGVDVKLVRSPLPAVAAGAAHDRSDGP